MARRKVNELKVDENAGINQVQELREEFVNPSIEVENARAQIHIEGQGDKFFLIADIKSGGSANTEVYSAIHLASNRLVAVKSIERERLRTKERILQTASDGTSLLQKAKKQDGGKYINIISALSEKNNPYIAYYLTDHVTKHNLSNPKEDRVFIALELLNYNNGKFPNNLKLFHEIIKKGDKLAASALGELPSIFARVCTGLEAAHDMGIIHRDLKPENIMMDLMFDDPDIENFDYSRASNSSDGYWSPSKRLVARLQPEDKSGPRPIIPKIVDFGAAEGELSGHASMSVWGTHLYTPPEHSAMRDNEMTVDIFQIGLMLYEIYIDNGERAELPLTAAGISGYSYGKLVYRITKRLIDQKELPEGIVGPDIQSIWSSARKEHFAEEGENEGLEEENEKRKKYAEIRQKVVGEIVTGRRQDGQGSDFTEGILAKMEENPLLGNIIAKAMAPDPKDRYTALSPDKRSQPMCELRRDILIANKKDAILGQDGKPGLETKARNELEAIARQEDVDGKTITRYHFRKETIALLNEIGDMIKDITEEDEQIRTDYRNQNRLPNNHEKSIGEYFLEDNDWKETTSIRKLYTEFKTAFQAVLPEIPLLCEGTDAQDGERKKRIIKENVRVLMDQAETWKNILEFGNGPYNGMDTIVQYVLKDPEARPFHEGPIRKIFYSLFQRKLDEVENSTYDFAKKCGDKPDQEESTGDNLAELGDELEVVHLESDEYKDILSACQIAFTIYTPKYADDIKTTETKNRFYHSQR